MRGRSSIRHLPLVLPVLALAHAACGDEPASALRVGDTGFPAEQVSALSAEQLHTLADLAGFAQAVAREELAALGEPIVEREAERVRLAALPLHLAAREMNLGEDALRAAYAAAPEWEIEVRHVVRLVPRWAAPGDRAEARRIAEEVHRRAVAGEDFARLATEFSEEPGAAERGGLLQPGREGSWVRPFWAAAVALEPGEVSPVVETEYGYHVLRSEDRRPVVFAEADRQRILAGLVPEARARAAMERWVGAWSDALLLNPPALATARQQLAAGVAPDTLLVAYWQEGEYSAWDLAVFRAALEGEERERLDRADDAAFGLRVEADAREKMWANEAREMGIAVPAAARPAAQRRWEQRAAVLARALGARAGMREDEIRTVALRGLGATGQEPRIARQELLGLRPLLRRRYPLSGDASPEPAPSAAASSSEMP